MSNLVNKAKEAVDKVIHPEHKEGHNTTGTTGTGVTGSHSTNAGPHDSNLGNKADPRVDSDRDGPRNLGANPMGTSTTHPGHATGHSAGVTGTGLTGSTGTATGSGLTGSTVHGSTNAGPHSSNIANTADPRVDSDMDGSRNMGMSSGYGASTTRGYGSQTAGPHSSNLANTADPRVDSNLDGSRTLGTTTGTTGATGSGLGHGVGTSGMTTGTTAPGSGLATHGAGTTGTTTGGLVSGSGPGPAPNTAGPHSSDMLNKADPRVDSDMDGSKTVGGNKTYTDDLGGDGQLDASKHSPSAFRRHGSDAMLPEETDHGKRHSLSKNSAKNTLGHYGSGNQ